MAWPAVAVRKRGRELVLESKTLERGFQFLDGKPTAMVDSRMCSHA